jgi:tetratricopeptide (TPR) repeat protein
MHYQNLEKLKRLKLFGMGRALEELQRLADRGQLDFADQLALLIDREASDRANTALLSRLRQARLRQTACFENLNMKAARGLDKGMIRDLLTCRWIGEHRHLIVTGKTGTGKSWIACALGNQAAREGYSVLYTRLSRLLDAYELYGRITQQAPGTEAARKSAEARTRLEKDADLLARLRQAQAERKARELLGLAQGYLKAGRPDIAREHLQKVLADYPQTPQAAEAKTLLAGLK